MSYVGSPIEISAALHSIADRNEPIVTLPVKTAIDGI
jgi:hypothetical protein